MQVNNSYHKFNKHKQINILPNLLLMFLESIE